jgi:hypothetical protein
MELRGRRSRSTPFPWLDRRVNRLAALVGHRPTTEILDERTAGPDPSTNPPLHSWNAENNCQRYDLLAEQLLPASLKHGNPPLPRPARCVNLRKSDAQAMTCAFVWSPDRGSSRTCDPVPRFASNVPIRQDQSDLGRRTGRCLPRQPLTCPDREKCSRPSRIRNQTWSRLCGARRGSTRAMICSECTWPSALDGGLSRVA